MIERTSAVVKFAGRPPIESDVAFRWTGGGWFLYPLEQPHHLPLIPLEILSAGVPRFSLAYSFVRALPKRVVESQSLLLSPPRLSKLFHSKIRFLWEPVVSECRWKKKSGISDFHLSVGLGLGNRSVGQHWIRWTLESDEKRQAIAVTKLLRYNIVDIDNPLLLELFYKFSLEIFVAFWWNNNRTLN